MVFIRELMKGKSDKEILEAEENCREYMLIVKEIADRLENEMNPENIKDSLDQEG